MLYCHRRGHGSVMTIEPDSLTNILSLAYSLDITYCYCS